MRTVAVIFIVIVLVVCWFDVRVGVTHYEDGSGIVAVHYCLPFTVCEGG